MQRLAKRHTKPYSSVINFNSKVTMSKLLKAIAGGLLLAATALPVSAATLKIASLAPDGSTWMNEMRAAGERIDAATEGRVKVKFYPGGVMGNDTTVLRKIRLGQLQGAALTGSELSILYKDAQIYSVPFLFRDDAEVDAIRKVVDPMLREGFTAKGFHVLSITGVGFAYLMSVPDVRSKTDLQKGKVWVPQNDTIAEITFREGGVEPIPLPLSDAFTGLQTGLIDTVATTPTAAIALQWHTKLKHLVDMPLSYVVGYVMLDQKAYMKLSEADRAVVDAEFAKGAANIDAANRSDNQKAFEALQEIGLKVFKPDAEEAALWRDVGKRALDKLVADKAFTAPVLGAIEGQLAKQRTAE